MMRFQLPPRPESLNHIPIPYVNSLSVKLIDGKGMGLFITKTLVERHGGTLVIESGLGEGTTVRVRLPLPPTGQVPQGYRTVPTS
jgi:signal transduction histidine kinase